MSVRHSQIQTLTQIHTGTHTYVPPRTGTALGPDYFEGRVLSTVVHLFTRQTTKATHTTATLTSTSTAGGLFGCFSLRLFLSYLCIHYVCKLINILVYTVNA